MTPFDVVLLPFPFTDRLAAKQRPCLVLARTHSAPLKPHYVVAMMTSQVGGPGFAHDVAVREWSAAGLPKPSLVRLAKVVTVEDSLIRRRLGRLAASDAERTRVEFRRMFGALLAPR